MEHQAQTEVSDFYDDKSLNTNWDNEQLANYVEDLHLDGDDVDPEAELPSGRDHSQLAVSPTVSPGTKAIATVPEPMAQHTEAIATVSEHSAQHTEAMASVLEPSAYFDQLFGPSTGEENVERSFDLDAILDSPAPATVDPTLGARGEIPQEEIPANDYDDQNELNLTLTETSTDEVLAVSVQMRELEQKKEEELSIDKSNSPSVGTVGEDFQMEVTPDSNVSN